MYKMCILLPTISPERTRKTINQLIPILNNDVHLFILAQGFTPNIDLNPYVTFKVFPDKVGTMMANMYAYRYAPDAEFYYFIDDDFEFRDGFVNDIMNVVLHMTLNDTKVVSLVCNITNGKSRKFDNSRFIRKAELKEIPFIRKESGIILHRDVYKGEHITTAYGEDNAKIVHAYLDGYEPHIAFVNVTHNNNSKEPDSWNIISEQMFGAPNKLLRKHFYGKEYFMHHGYLNQNQTLTEKAISIHAYNKSRLKLINGGNK